MTRRRIRLKFNRQTQ